MYQSTDETRAFFSLAPTTEGTSVTPHVYTQQFHAPNADRMPEPAHASVPVSNLLPQKGKRTRGKQKIKIEYIRDKKQRYTYFSKRKSGLLKKAAELAALTGEFPRRRAVGNTASHPSLFPLRPCECNCRCFFRRCRGAGDSRLGDAEYLPVFDNEFPQHY